MLAALDGWASQWLAAREDTCHAEERAAQPQRAQISCLEEQRRLVAALVEDLSSADAATLRQAPEAIGSLPPPSLCRAVAGTPRPAPQLDGADLAAARAALVLGKLELAQARATAALEQARASDARQAQASAVELLGEVAHQRGDFAAAEALYRDAIAQAERAGANAALAQAWVRLTDVVGVALRRHDEGLLLADFASAVADARGDGADRAALLLTRAEILNRKGALSEALAQAQQAQAAAQLTFGSAHWRVAQTLNLVGQVLRNLHRLDEALAAFQHAEALFTQCLGALHPKTLAARDNQGIALCDLRRFPEAEALARAVLAARLQVQPEHPVVAASYVNLGRVLKAQGHKAEAAQAYAEAVRRKEQAFGPTHVEVAIALNNLAGLKADLGEPEESLRLHQRAYDIRLAALGPTHLDVAMSAVNLGHIHQELGQCAEALPFFAQALAIEEQRLGPLDSVLAEELTGLGECSLSLGKPQAALPLLERAVALRTGAGADEDPQDVAQSRFALARALRATRTQPARAAELARQARREASAEVTRAIAAWSAQGAPH